jgi:hypothetical protein
MEIKVSTAFDCFLRAQGFLDANDPVLSDVNRSAARQSLDAAIDGLRAQTVEQEHAVERGRGETNKYRALHVALRRQTRAVVTIARNNHGGIYELRTLRQSPTRTSLRSQLTRANALAAIVDAHPALFATGGLAPTFMPAFRATIASLEQLAKTRNDSKSTQVQATQASSDHAREGRRAVKVLDALVKLEAADDATLLAGWKSASRYYGGRATAKVVAPQEVTAA